MQKISTLEVATKKPMESVILTLPPGNDFIFQTIACRSGAYAAEPIEVLIFGFVASEGTGTSISTFVAVLEMKKKRKYYYFPKCRKCNRSKPKKNADGPSFLKLTSCLNHEFYPAS
jgi:hypothetical protein